MVEVNYPFAGSDRAALTPRSTHLPSSRAVGIFLVKVLDPKGKTFLDPVMKPIERLLYKVLGIDP